MNRHEILIRHMMKAEFEGNLEAGLGVWAGKDRERDMGYRWSIVIDEFDDGVISTRVARWKKMYPSTTERYDWFEVPKLINDLLIAVARLRGFL